MPHEELVRELRTRAGDLRRMADCIREEVASPRASAPDRYFLTALADDVHDFFNALEDAVHRVSHEVNGEVPGGPGSHKRILERVLAEVPGKRRALFSAETAVDLDELLRFQHFFRHKYGVERDPRKTIEHAQRVLRVAPRAVLDLEEYANGLSSGGGP